ncbi:MAG: molybdopterin-dependent oxidoreductase, partial [Chloroflexi bacterium]|nr:molybdopterin-dependent oxidoreductase [Chloroflexota bacterium]
LDFLVVQDMFLTETAKLATVVLPAASFAEKEGTFTNFEGRVQRIRKAISPLGESLPDWEIVLQLASKINKPMSYSSLQQIMDEIEDSVPLYQGIGYSDSEVKGVYRAESGNGPLGVRRMYKGQSPRAFDRFCPAEWSPESRKIDDAYPLTLLAGTTLYQAGTGSTSSKSRRLREFQPEAFVEINEADARDLGINHGDEVNVVSPQGEITAKARIADTVAQGMSFMPICFPGSPVNALFDICLDARSKNPCLKACNVRLERMGSGGSM